MESLDEALIAPALAQDKYVVYSADQSASVHQLRLVSTEIRRWVLRMVHRVGSGHLGGPLSAADLIAVLFFHELAIDPDRPYWEDRDRFVLSKGHASAALYAALALRGFFPLAELSTFDVINSRLQAHPDMSLLPGIDMSTGSLGQGLSLGIGLALAARLRRKTYRTFVLLGDGECQEGQVWEAAMVAAKYGLDSLTAVLDWNRLQQYGWSCPSGGRDSRMNPIESPSRKWSAFGWKTVEVDGHDHGAILEALRDARQTPGRPSIVIARTVKGKGVSFMEGHYLWHSASLSDDDFDTAMAELSE